MDYQPGPRPEWTSSFNPPTPLPTPQPSDEVIPYDHRRYGMVILTVLSLAKVVVPHLGAYCPLAAGMLYLSCSLPFLYWALVSRYPNGWTPSQPPWFDTTPSHDSLSTSLLGNLSPYILMIIGASFMLVFSIIAYCLYRLVSRQTTIAAEAQNSNTPAQIQTITVSTANHNAASSCALPNIQKMNLADVRRGLVLMGAHFKAFPNQYTDKAHKVLTVGSMLIRDALDWFTSALEDNEDLCLNYNEFKSQLLKATTPKGTRIQALIKLLALEQRHSP
ncbi:hypothetical protein DSO57_1038414 [Entomophthora muscae]|uniref:Uncharacterized protein n=1 Tax=Entomophthora muscae TaxID=34485 RepID=A0ACC2S0U8_9FUNG|nr:hypothetical protein DSO57_1038414 [Entomophthora muscae]